jgi:hypothetical protein
MRVRCAFLPGGTSGVKELRIAEARGAPRIDIVVLSAGGTVYAYGERRAEGGLFVVSGVF